MNKKLNFKSAKYQLATDIDVGTPSYAGVLALPYLAPAVKLADTVANGYITELDGITHKAVVNTLTPGDMLKEGACDWDQDPTSLTLGESVLEVKDLMVNERVCRGTIYPTWVAAQMRGRDGAIPASFADFLMATVANKAAEEQENGIWLGIDLTADYVGFLSNDGVFDRPGLAAGKLATGAGKTNGQAIASLTAANIIAQMGLVFDNANTNCSGILGKPDVQFLVGNKTAGLYMQALATAGAATNAGAGYNNQVSNQSFGALNFLGIEINVCPGMPADAIVLCQKSNLFFGTNLGTDMTEAKLIPFYQYDGSDNVGVSMRMATGVQVGVPTDVVVGTTAAILPA